MYQLVELYKYSSINNQCVEGVQMIREIILQVWVISHVTLLFL